MLDKMRVTINNNLLKYSAGRAIFCPGCQTIADWRNWTIVERPDGSIAGTSCNACHDAAMGDKTMPAGYQVIRHGKPVKSPKLERKGFPATKGALNAALRRDIFAAFKRGGYTAKVDREFPKGFGTASWPMVETTDADGTVRIDYAGDPHFTPAQTAAYIAEFCRLNHLRGA